MTFKFDGWPNKNQWDTSSVLHEALASFQTHWWIQTAVTVQKRSIWIKISDFLSCVTLKYDGWPWQTIGRLFYATSSFANQFKTIGEYGPVTMIVPASGHQVRCIPWVQMDTFNKEIGFLCGLKCFALNIFCGEYLQSSLHLLLQIWWKPLLWKMCQ